jgi:type II secretory pathway component GspD/PulD (secretin)
MFGGNIKNSEILIFKIETKTFTVYALPTERDYNQSLSSDANSTSKVGQALTTTLDNKTEIKTWENIDESIKNILESDEDSKYTADKASGMVTITASPTQMRKIAEYVTELNKNLSRQVAVSVKVLKLTISDTERFNLDPLISLDNIFSQKFGIQGALKGASNTALTDYTGVTWGVPGTSTTATDVPGIAFRIFDSTSNPTKHLNGSSMVIDALSTQGTVSV